MTSETHIVVISGIESENLALELTKALLLLQREKQRSKPAWRNLQFRPYALPSDIAEGVFRGCPPVLLHDSGTALQIKAGTRAPPTLAPSYPSLQRSDRKGKPGVRNERKPARLPYIDR